MFWKFVTSAVKLRRGRLILAVTAMAVAGALATSMFTVYSDVERKITEQFQAYGPNVIVGPSGGALTVPLDSLPVIRTLGGTAAPFLYSLRQLDGRAVVLAGADAGGSLTQSWHVDGKRGACLAGTSLERKIGETVHLDDFSCIVDGIVATGAAEDSQIIVPFATAARLANLQNAASIIQVRMPSARVPDLQKALPDAEVRLNRADAATESSVVLKVRVALYLLMAVILVIVTLSVSSNFGEIVMERSKEIGILKAIGAREGKIAGLFLAEALLLGAFSTVIGYGLGVVLAGWIDRSIFDAAFALHISAQVLLLTALVTLSVAVLATALAAGRIWRIQPAAILRGE